MDHVKKDEESESKKGKFPSLKFILTIFSFFGISDNFD